MKSRKERKGLEKSSGQPSLHFSHSLNMSNDRKSVKKEETAVRIPSSSLEGGEVCEV